MFKKFLLGNGLNKISTFLMTGGILFPIINSLAVKTIYAAPTTPTSATASSTVSASSSATFHIPNLIPFKNLGDLFQVLLSLAFFAAGLAFFLNLIVGGFQWISSGGDPKALQTARGRIMNAFVGLIIVVAAYAIALIVQTVLGIRIVSGFCIRLPGGTCP